MSEYAELYVVLAERMKEVIALAYAAQWTDPEQVRWKRPSEVQAYLSEGCPTPEQVAMLEEAAELLELWERTRQSARHKPPIDDHGQTADWLIRYREAGEEDG